VLVDDFVYTAQVLIDPGSAIPYHVLIIIYNLTFLILILTIAILIFTIQNDKQNTKIHMHDLHVIGRNHIPRKSVLGS
jgi:hypothetical protein